MGLLYTLERNKGRENIAEDLLDIGVVDYLQKV
jgi:hypothetical protein